MTAKFEARRFFSQLGQRIQQLSDNGEIFFMLEQHLTQMNLNGFLDRDTIEDLLAQATQEALNITAFIIIDGMDNEQFRVHANKKNYDRPSEIMKNNLRALEGQRALEDDNDFIQNNCNAHVVLSEADEEVMVDSEAVLSVFQNYRFMTAAVEHLSQSILSARRDADYVEAIIEYDFQERARYENRWNSVGNQ